MSEYYDNEIVICSNSLQGVAGCLWFQKPRSSVRTTQIGFSVVTRSLTSVLNPKVFRVLCIIFRWTYLISTNHILVEKNSFPNGLANYIDSSSIFDRTFRYFCFRKSSTPWSLRQMCYLNQGKHSSGKKSLPIPDWRGNWNLAQINRPFEVIDQTRKKGKTLCWRTNFRFGQTKDNVLAQDLPSCRFLFVPCDFWLKKTY